MINSANVLCSWSNNIKVYISHLSIVKETVLLNKLLSVKLFRGDAGHKGDVLVWCPISVVVVVGGGGGGGVGWGVLMLLLYAIRVCAAGCGLIFVPAGQYYCTDPKRLCDWLSSTTSVPQCTEPITCKLWLVFIELQASGFCFLPP